MAVTPVKLKMDAEYLKGESFAVKAEYDADNSTAILLINRLGQRDLTATVCIHPNPPPAVGHVYIKTWSEGAGILESLIANKVLRDTYVRIAVGHNCQVAVCELIMELPDAN